MSDKREQGIKMLELETKRIKLEIEEYKAIISRLQVRGMGFTERLCKLREEKG